MGTTYHVKVVHEGLTDTDHAEIETEIGVALDTVNQLMSTYDPESEVSRFNASESTEPFPLSEQTAEVIRLALDTWRQSDGAFDITVCPLVELWGFGAKGRRTEPPPADKIEACLKRTGSQHLHLLDGPALKKDLPALQIDLSAIAKGYAVDQTAELLEARQFGNYLVEVGGECRARGHNDRGDAWQVGVDRPDPGNLPGDRLAKIIALKDAALATSGNYRNFFEYEGKRYSHTLDTTTGWPVTHSLASASVIAPTCAQADALATAITALGAEKGLALAEDIQGAEALLLTRREDGSFEEVSTVGLKDCVAAARRG